METRKGGKLLPIAPWSLVIGNVLALTFILFTLAAYPEVLWIIAVMIGAAEIPDH